MPRALSLLFALAMMPASHGFFLQLTDPSGETVHSPEFIADYNAASEAAGQGQSIKPMADLLGKYTGTNERAELQYSLGLLYGQRTGVVDYPKSITHFTEALGFKLPHAKRIDAYMLRGNAYENDDQDQRALEDYLRGLLDCSEHDLSGPWPSDAPAPLAWNHHSKDPVEIQKGRDYIAQRDRNRRIQHLMRQKHYFIDAIKRVRAEKDLKTVLSRFASGEEERISKVLGWIEAENPRPWP